MNIPITAYAFILWTLLIGIAGLYLHLCLYMLDVKSTTRVTIAIKSCCAVAGDNPLSHLSLITVFKPLEAAFAICSLYLSLVFIIMLRILTCSFS